MNGFHIDESTISFCMFVLFVYLFIRHFFGKKKPGIDSEDDFWSDELRFGGSRRLHEDFMDSRGSRGIIGTASFSQGKGFKRHSDD